MGFASHCHVLSPQIFLVTVWHWELFMLPLFLLLLIGWHYFQLTAGKTSSNQDLVRDDDSGLWQHLSARVFRCISTLVEPCWSDGILFSHIGKIMSINNSVGCRKPDTVYKMPLTLQPVFSSIPRFIAG